MNIDDIKIELSNEDKVLFNESGITKGDIIEYYKKISPVMLPHIKGRPLTLHRYPDGINEKGFYQKQISNYFPKWIDRVSVNKKEGEKITHVLCNDKKTLIYLANQACITFHAWLSNTDNLNKPNRMVFDLDPSNDDITLIIKAAKELKRTLDNFNLKSYLMTTGSRGVHVVVPIIPEFNFDEVRNYAKKIAEMVVKKNPDQYTVEHRKEKRNGRVFIDYLRNSYAQTSVVPYSIRSKKGATVATPLEWSEINSKDFDPQKYTINNIFRRLGQKEDPWKNIDLNKGSLKDIN